MRDACSNCFIDGGRSRVPVDKRKFCNTDRNRRSNSWRHKRAVLSSLLCCSIRCAAIIYIVWVRGQEHSRYLSRDENSCGTGGGRRGARLHVSIRGRSIRERNAYARSRCSNVRRPRVPSCIDELVEQLKRPAYSTKAQDMAYVSRRKFIRDSWKYALLLERFPAARRKVRLG